MGDIFFVVVGMIRSIHSLDAVSVKVDHRRRVITAGISDGRLTMNLGSRLERGIEELLHSNASPRWESNMCSTSGDSRNLLSKPEIWGRIGL